MTKPLLSVVIPAHNEAKRLPVTLLDIKKHFEKVDFPYEIIIVNNNSTDHTADVVSRMAHLWQELKLIENKIPGKGASVKMGMLEANGEIRAFTDADNSISIDQIIKTIPYFKEQGFDVVYGSRDTEGGSHDQPWYRRFSGNLGNLLIQILLLPGIFDTQCPLKVFTEEAAKEIFPRQKTNGWAFDVEILSMAKKLGYKIKEIPAVFKDEEAGSKIGLMAYIQVLRDVFIIRFRLWTNVYGLNRISKINNKNKHKSTE